MLGVVGMLAVIWWMVHLHLSRIQRTLDMMLFVIETAALNDKESR